MFASLFVFLVIAYIEIFNAFEVVLVLLLLYIYRVVSLFILRTCALVHFMWLLVVEQLKAVFTPFSVF